jgi:hypothetical protein
MTTHDLETAFSQAAMQNYNEAGTALKYNATYWLQMLQQYGAVDAARRLIAGEGLGSEGLTRLWEGGRLDLSAEALMLKPEYRALFTDAERARAREILAAHNYTAPWDSETTNLPAPSTPPSITDNSDGVIHPAPNTMPPMASAKAEAVRVWLFQANPQFYKLAEELKEEQVGNRGNWAVTTYRSEMQAGDVALLWQSGKDRGIYAVAELLGAPYQRDWEPEPEDLIKRPYTKATWWVDLRYIQILEPPLLADQIKQHPLLQNLGVLTFANATNYRVTPDQWAEIKQLLPPLPLTDAIWRVLHTAEEDSLPLATIVERGHSMGLITPQAPISLQAVATTLANDDRFVHLEDDRWALNANEETEDLADSTPEGKKMLDENALDVEAAPTESRPRSLEEWQAGVTPKKPLLQRLVHDYPSWLQALDPYIEIQIHGRSELKLRLAGQTFQYCQFNDVWDLYKPYPVVKRYRWRTRAQQASLPQHPLSAVGCAPTRQRRMCGCGRAGAPPTRRPTVADSARPQSKYAGGGSSSRRYSGSGVSLPSSTLAIVCPPPPPAGRTPP